MIAKKLVHLQISKMHLFNRIKQQSYIHSFCHQLFSVTHIFISHKISTAIKLRHNHRQAAKFRALH